MRSHELPVGVLTNLLSPLVGGVIFVFVFLYFTAVRKRIAEVYPYYKAFTLSFAVFLWGRPVQMFVAAFEPHYTLYVRMLMLYTVGLPSLLAAATLHSKTNDNHRRRLFVGFYGTGGLITLLYCLSVDAADHQHILSQRVFEFLGILPGCGLAHFFQFLGALLLLFVPFSWLLFREIRGDRNIKLIGYYSGSWLMGAFILVAVPHPMKLEYFYVGSLISAGCWVWAVFKDIQDMTGKVGC